MERPRSLVSAAALMVAAVAFSSPPARSQPAPDEKPPTLIEGLATREWLDALDDPDPAGRKWALRILGRVTPDRAGDAFPAIRDAVWRAAAREGDPDVRRAAERSLLGLARSLDTRRRAIGQRERSAVRTPIRLVDGRGKPVAGATVSTYFERHFDRSPSFEPFPSIEAATSGAGGEAALWLEVPHHLDGAGVYAIRPGKDAPLVGLSKVTPDRLGRPLTIEMHPACRVRLRIECAGFRDLGKKYHFSMDASAWWRAAYVMLGESYKSPRPLFTSSTSGRLEFFLPPGQFRVMAYGEGSDPKYETVRIKPGHRVRNLGIIDVSPGLDLQRGIFRGSHHLVREEPRGRRGAGEDGQTNLVRPIRWGPMLSDSWTATSDVAFSPDGHRLATAHGRDAGEAEVKIWDPRTGRLVATWPTPDEEDGVFRLAFAPDARTLAGSVGSAGGLFHPGTIVVWDVEGRRAPLTIRGPTARVTALAYSPDGKTLASACADGLVIFWDPADGREVGRLERKKNPVSSLAYSPDGRTLAIAAGLAVELRDATTRRLGAPLETEAAAVKAIAFAPDGRSLAVAGTARDRQAHVWLYDVTEQPAWCEMALSLDRRGFPPPDPNTIRESFTDVAFTPDARSVVAMSPSSVALWDAADGDQRDFIDREPGLLEGGLDVSPDGRWLALPGYHAISLIDLNPQAP